MSHGVGPFVFEGEGMKRIYENDKWTVGIKNFKPSNSLEGFRELERHNATDELFVLLSGSCVLVVKTERDGAAPFACTRMEARAVYSIPRGVWHTTITEADSKLVLIEDSATSPANTDVCDLSDEERRTVTALVIAARKGLGV